jgi:hypothetical protein
MADDTNDLADEARAGQFFRVESQGSTISASRKVRSFLANLVSSAVQLTAPTTWPPVDIVLLELSTGLVVRRWHEGGEDAASLLMILNDDLITMRPEKFIEKWDVPVT